VHTQIYLYNRNTTVSDSEFVWVGESGIVSVGSTDKIDGTGKRHCCAAVFTLLKIIFLPRQARDKHRENSLKEMRFP
jgi:hypothetical protein